MLIDFNGHSYFIFILLVDIAEDERIFLLFINALGSYWGSKLLFIIMMGNAEF